MDSIAAKYSLTVRRPPLITPRNYYSTAEFRTCTFGTAMSNFLVKLDINISCIYVLYCYSLSCIPPLSSKLLKVHPIYFDFALLGLHALFSPSTSSKVVKGHIIYYSTVYGGIVVVIEIRCTSSPPNSCLFLSAIASCSDWIGIPGLPASPPLTNRKGDDGSNARHWEEEEKEGLLLTFGVQCFSCSLFLFQWLPQMAFSNGWWRGYLEATPALQLFQEVVVMTAAQDAEGCMLCASAIWGPAMAITVVCQWFVNLYPMTNHNSHMLWFANHLTAMVGYPHLVSSLQRRGFRPRVLLAKVPGLIPTSPVRAKKPSWLKPCRVTASQCWHHLPNSGTIGWYDGSFISTSTMLCKLK